MRLLTNATACSSRSTSISRSLRQPDTLDCLHRLPKPRRPSHSLNAPRPSPSTSLPPTPSPLPQTPTPSMRPQAAQKRGIQPQAPRSTSSIQGSSPTFTWSYVPKASTLRSTSTETTPTLTVPHPCAHAQRHASPSRTSTGTDATLDDVASVVMATQPPDDIPAPRTIIRFTDRYTHLGNPITTPTKVFHEAHQQGSLSQGSASRPIHGYPQTPRATTKAQRPHCPRHLSTSSCHRDMGQPPQPPHQGDRPCTTRRIRMCNGDRLIPKTTPPDPRQPDTSNPGHARAHFTRRPRGPTLSLPEATRHG